MRRFILFGLLLFLLYWRFRVGMTRFFDVDEFTYLHWVAAMGRGSKPYIDYFSFITPGFNWFLMPLYWAFGGSTFFFIAARGVAFFIFLGILGCLGYLFGIMRGWRWAMLPMILLAFLPMPYDKFLEVRPDNLATLLAIIGVIGEIGGIRGGKKNWWFLSGVFYSLSLIVLVKLLPFAVVGIAVALIYRYTTRQAILPFFAGFLLPLIIVGFWVLSLGNLPLVLYSLGPMSLETNTLGKALIMEPHLFFFPNAAFYGGWGVTAALVTNHAIWILGILVGVVRLFTPFLTAKGDKRKVLTEQLLSWIFLISVAGYILFFPLKHSQYLIPIAVFIAFYAADGLQIILDKVPFLLIFSFLLWQQTIAVNQPKLALSNTQQLRDIVKLKSIIPASDEVFDLDGRMIYWKDPYYICCLPMGRFIPFMSRPPAKLAAVLEARQVPYIYQGESGRLWELTDDLPYIQSHYEKVPGWGDALWKRKNL